MVIEGKYAKLLSPNPLVISGAVSTLLSDFVESTPQSRMPVEDMKFPSPAGSVKYTVGRLECTGSGKSLLEGGIIQILHV